MYKHILVALDGSKASHEAGQTAIAFAQATGCRITACHVYGAEYHRQRFADMEPGLPPRYQDAPSLSYLRTTHDKLIHEGFQSLSSGYVERFLDACGRRGIQAQSVAAEGRSYVGILHLTAALKCDLIALGADGLGAVGNGLLGGTTARILDSAPCDVLIARREPTAGPILGGVDGSEAALNAVDQAVALGRAMNRPVHLAAVYDPNFHTHVFSVMAQSLSAETQAEIGLDGQEQLHDEIINDGLGKLYGEFLEAARQRCTENHLSLSQSLLKGKPYCALASAVNDLETDLIVIGRHGHHRQPFSRIGSNADGLIRTASANVLLVGGVDAAPAEHLTAVAATAAPASAPGTSLVWEPAAEARLQRVPSFVRMMAKQMVEQAARQSGRPSISVDDFDAVAARFGMAPKGDGQ